MYKINPTTYQFLRGNYYIYEGFSQSQLIFKKNRYQFFIFVESCSLWNLNFNTSTPLQVIISWNTTVACHNAVYTLLMKGPNQNFTKQLQKNSNFIVIKNIHPDMDYEVSIYLKEEQLISRTFTSPAMGKDLDNMLFIYELFDF